MHTRRMESTNLHARARGKPAFLWKRPELPRGWVRVLERHPEGVQGLPGYVWLDMPGKVRSVDAHELEFTDQPPP